jgi:TRAP-type C4-dicarboxylate transport system substrate-binding protein
MVADMFRSIDAVPIRQAPGDWYTSLDRELINAIALGIVGVTMFKLEEVVKIHIIPSGDSMGYVGTSVIMNKGKFEKMPQEVQQIMAENVRWASERMTAIEDANNAVSEDKYKKAGNTFINLTEEETAQWREAFVPLKKKWIAEMNKKGLPGQQVFDDALRMAKEYEK